MLFLLFRTAIFSFADAKIPFFVEKRLCKVFFIIKNTIARKCTYIAGQGTTNTVSMNSLKPDNTKTIEDSFSPVFFNNVNKDRNNRKEQDIHD